MPPVLLAVRTLSICLMKVSIENIIIYHIETKYAMLSVQGNNGLMIPQELQVEHDEEQRFQADLKQAVRQSLGMVFLYDVLLLF